MKNNFLTFFSPAKINLLFKILYKRKDGFHEIISINQTIDLYDIINISLSKKDIITCKNNPALSKKDNIIYKAIDIFKKKTKKTFFLTIILKKNIPIKSGLGGGSSNAATILWALNKILNTKLSANELIKIGSEIGSDVPFFFSNGSALCQGKGEIIKNIKLKLPYLTIATPNFGISTKEVYENITNFSKNYKFEHKKKLEFSNDLENYSFNLNPNLIKIKSTLYKIGFKKVVMTGSGSSFFCFGNSFKKHSILKNTTFYKVKAINRDLKTWYNT